MVIRPFIVPISVSALALHVVTGCGSTKPEAKTASSTPTAEAAPRKELALPGASGPVTLDYLAFDASRARVWVPVGDTGSADVLDLATGAFSRVGGFKAKSQEHRGKTRMMGPSAAAVGDGVVYVGNRGTSEVCAVDAGTLALGRCQVLASPPDGVVYVPSAKELWVTTPRNQTLTILDASTPDSLKEKVVIAVPGAPEGYAVDEKRGLFYTNLEDKDQTLALEIATHTIRTTWASGCGADGPRGVAVDSARNLVFVACTEKVRVLDGARGGELRGTFDTGAGVDNLDYHRSTNLLYVAAAKAARLTVARIDDQGHPTIVRTAVTSEGARNAVADAAGNVYVADPIGARLLILPPPPPNAASSR